MIKEKQELIDKQVQRWGKIKLLDGIRDKHLKGETAVMLENQRLINESLNETDTFHTAQFKRISIPLVRRIVPQLLAGHLASIQGLVKSTGTIFYYQKNKLVSEQVTASTKKMKTIWAFEGQQDLRSVNNLDAEAELTAVLAMELVLELDRMFLTTIRNGAKLIKQIDYDQLGELPGEKSDGLQNAVYELGIASKERYGRAFPKWIVTSREMCDALNPTPISDPNNYFMGTLGIQKYGSLTTDEGEITIYADPLFPMGQAVMGYKGEDPYDAGFVFSPYVMVSLTPTVIDPDSFTPIKGIMCRYAYRLTDPTYYAVLKVDNFRVLDYRETMRQDQLRQAIEEKLKDVPENNGTL